MTARIDPDAVVYLCEKATCRTCGMEFTEHRQFDPENCVACATCVKVCPYGAPMINQLSKAEIQGAKCMGCGSCAAACPARTITLQHQEDRALVAMLDELLVGGVIA